MNTKIRSDQTPRSAKNLSKHLIFVFDLDFSYFISLMSLSIKNNMIYEMYAISVILKGNI